MVFIIVIACRRRFVSAWMKGRVVSESDTIDRVGDHVAKTGEENRAFAAARLARLESCVPPTTLCAEVLHFFSAREDLAALAVVKDGRVIGLIDRNRVLTTFARPLMADLYADQPVGALMDPAPLVIDSGAPIGEIGLLIAETKPSALTTGFVITENGRYLGLGSALDLMQMTARQNELRTRQFEEARRIAEEESRAKTSFLANASHELRTPLNAIMGFAEILQQEVLGPLGNDVYRQYAGDIVDSGRHLLELINDLLDLSKAELDRLELLEGIVDLPRVCAVCARLICDRATGAGVRLLCALPKDAPALRGDERRVRQMLLNLLSNAVKFTQAGGSVTVDGAYDDEGGYRLSVTDTGIGMTAEEMESALEPWRRVDTALNRRLIGTGLGLPLTKRLIELHGGFLAMTSSPSSGTSIALAFPPDRVLASVIDADSAPIDWTREIPEGE